MSQSFDDRDEVRGGDISSDEDGYIKDKGDIIITMLAVILKV